MVSAGVIYAVTAEKCALNFVDYALIFEHLKRKGCDIHCGEIMFHSEDRALGESSRGVAAHG